MKLKNSNCDKTQKLKLWLNSKTHIVIKLELWWNSKTEIVIKLKTLKGNKTKKKVKNSKAQVQTKLNNSNCDKTQKLKLWQD